MKDKRFGVLATRYPMDEKPRYDVFQKELREKGRLDGLIRYLGIEEIALLLKRGCCIVPAIFKTGATARREKFIEGKEMIFLDFDGHMTIEEFKRLSTEKNLVPNILHTSSSHLKDGETHKFRAIYFSNKLMDKETHKYNADLLTEGLGGYEKWKFARSDGVLKKQVVQPGIDPASRKYNQIFFGYCAKDKRNLICEVNHYNLMEVKKVPPEYKKKIEEKRRERGRVSECLKGCELEFFEEYPLHKSFAEGCQKTFGGPGSGTFYKYFAVGCNYNFLGKKDRFEELLKKYDREASQFRSLEENEDLYPTEDFVSWVIEYKGTPEKLRNRLMYEKSQFGIYEHSYGYRYIKREEKKNGDVVYKSHLITDFTLHIERLVRGSEREELAYKIMRNGEVLKSATKDLEILNSKVKFNQAIGFANFMGGTDIYLSYIKRYALWKYADRIVKGVGKLTYKKGIYIGNSRSIDGYGNITKDYVLEKSGEALKSEIELQEPISQSELSLIKGPLFNFNHPGKCRLIMGWIGAVFLKPHLEIPFPYLFLTGGHESGKTSTGRLIGELFSVKDEGNRVHADAITKFTISKIASSSEVVPLHLDEYKLSKMTSSQEALASAVFRTAYNRGSLPRGRADQSYVEYRLTAPLLITGETQTEENAVMDRSILIELLKSEKTDEFTYLLGRKKLLNKLGYTALCKALVKERDLVEGEYKKFEYFLKNGNYDDRERKNLSWILLGLKFWEEILEEKASILETIKYYDHVREDLRKPPMERFLEAFDDLYQAEYIRWDCHFKIVNGTLRIDWPRFYPQLKAGVENGVTNYEILTNKDLKKYLGSLDGTHMRVRTRLAGRNPWCVSIPVSSEMLEAYVINR